MGQFLRTFRGTSLQEEYSHSLQRTIAAGNEGQARRHHTQAALFVLRSAAKNYMRRGGRDLATAKRTVRKAAKVVQKKKVVHSRPNQTGFAGWTYLAKQRERGDHRSKDDILADWRRMGSSAQDVWKARHRVAVRLKRDREAQMAERASQIGTQAASLKTPWDLGDGDFPLRQEFLQDWLRPFRTRDTGLAVLQDPDASSDEDCALFCRQLQENPKKYYNSMDAARLAAKRNISASITSKSAQASDSTREILATRRAELPCPLKHPGLCATRHASVAADVQSMLQVLPKEACLLRCEVALARKPKLVVHAKVIVGSLVGLFH